MRTMLLAAAAAVAFAGQSAGQATPLAPPTFVWITAGGGGGSEGFAALGDVTLARSVHTFSLRATAMADIFDDSVWDVGLLYGRTMTTGVARGAVAIGLAVVGVEDCVAPGCGSPATVGIPITIRGTLLPTRHIGLGLYGWANVNPERTFAGLALAVALGRLR